jgi:hypothetical protein
MKMSISWLFIMMLSMLGCQNPEPEDYLIPQGFTGRVNIIFNQKNGVAPKYENARRVYEIPQDGILLTQFKDEYGLVNRRYYYVDSNGKKVPLKIYEYEYNKDGTTKWIIKNPGEVGIFSDGTTGQYGNEDDSKSVKWQEFVVSSYSLLDSFYTVDYKKKFDDRIEKITGLKLN